MKDRQTGRRLVAEGLSIPPDRVLAVMEALRRAEVLAPGVLYWLGVAHDGGCPCTEGAALKRCTCAAVDVRVYARPRAAELSGAGG